MSLMDKTLSQKSGTFGFFGLWHIHKQKAGGVVIAPPAGSLLYNSP
jgi:hypothetical protein